MRRVKTLVIGVIVSLQLAGVASAGDDDASPWPELVPGPGGGSPGGVMAPEQIFAEGREDGILVVWRMWLPVAYVDLGRVNPDGNYVFEIWRAEANGTLERHDTSPWTRPYYFDRDVPHFTNYTYSVRVVREDGATSAFSPNATAQACPWDYGYCEASYREDPEEKVPYLQDLPIWQHMPEVGPVWDVAYEVIATVWRLVGQHDLACEQPATWPCIHSTDDIVVNGTGCESRYPGGSWARVPCTGGALSVGGNVTCEGDAVCAAGTVQGNASCSGPCLTSASTHHDAACNSDTYTVLAHDFYTPALYAAPPCVGASTFGDARCTGSDGPITQWYFFYSQTPSIVCVATSAFGDATCRAGGADFVPTRAIRAQAPPLCIAVSVFGNALCESRESGAEWRSVTHENEGRRGPSCIAITQFGTARCAIEAENKACAAVSGHGSAIAACAECVAVALEDATATCMAVSDGFTYRGTRPVCAAASVLGHASCLLKRDGTTVDCVGLSALGPATCNGEPCGSGTSLLDPLNCRRLGVPCATPETRGPLASQPADTSKCKREEARVNNSRFAVASYDDCEQTRGVPGYVEYSEHVEVRALGGSYGVPYACIRHGGVILICL